MSVLGALAGPALAVRDRLAWASMVDAGVGARVRGHVWVHGGGIVRLGDRVVLDARRAPIELRASRGAELIIGEDTIVEGGASIEALRSVQIGPRCFIGAWSKVLDNHFHPLRGDRRDRIDSDPVEIGSDVLIGERCVVLPGTRLENSVRLGHGVVIGRNVPTGVHLEGSPPRRVQGGIRS